LYRHQIDHIGAFFWLALSGLVSSSIFFLNQVFQSLAIIVGTSSRFHPVDMLTSCAIRISDLAADFGRLNWDA
jgi:hypothetical protein